MSTAAAVAERVRAFWCRVPSRANFGDALTPWLIRRLTGRCPRFTAPDDPVHKYLVAGSIAAYASPRSTVWGAGILDASDEPSPLATYRCVRGPLTRSRVRASGGTCPEAYGDPALMLPLLYTPAARARAGVGVVAHFSDLPRVAPAIPSDGDVRLVDVQAPVERVVDALASCEAVVSSSLHGLIASHAFGVPAAWIKFRDLPSGDDSKFHDYFLSVGLPPQGPAWIDARALTRRRVLDLVDAPPHLDVTPLVESCPFAGVP